MTTAQAHSAPTDRGILYAVLAMALFATMDGIGKHLTGTYTVTQIMWVRYALFVCFGIYMASRGGLRRTATTRRLAQQLARSLVLVAETAAFITAFKFLPLAETHAIAASAPLIVTALAASVLGERVGIRRWAATLIGFVGVLIIVRPGLGVFSAAAIIPMVAAVLFAVYQIMTRQLSIHDSAETTLLYTGLVGVVVLSGLAPFGWQWPTATDWGLLLAVGVLGSSAHWLFILALRAAPASVLQPYNYTLVLFAAIVGFIGFRHVPDAVTLIGGAIVIAGGLYTLHRETLRRTARAG